MLSKIINFFSTKSVKEKIMANTLSEGQLFLYFYLILMFDTAAMTQQCLSVIGKNPTALELVNIWGFLIINAVGYLIVFLVNGGVKGKNLISKFFAFSLTVGIKYFFILVILDALMTILFPMTQAYNIAMYVLVNILMVANIAFRVHETR